MDQSREDKAYWLTKNEMFYSDVLHSD